MAWLRESALIHVTPNLSTVLEIKSLYPPTDEFVHIVAWTHFDSLTAHQFDRWIESQNANHFGVWLMGFHPDSPDDPLTPEFSGNGADDYALILVQSYAHLIEASDRLRKTRYYSKFPQSDMAYINKRKEIYSAWNEKVDAKALQAYEEEAIEKRVQAEKTEH